MKTLSPSLVTVVASTDIDIDAVSWTNWTQSLDNITIAHVHYQSSHFRFAASESRLDSDTALAALDRFSDIVCFIAASHETLLEMSVKWVNENICQRNAPIKRAAYLLKTSKRKLRVKARKQGRIREGTIYDSLTTHFHRKVMGEACLRQNPTEQPFSTELISLSSEMVRDRLRHGRGWNMKSLTSLLSHWSNMTSRRTSRSYLEHEEYEAEEEVRLLTDSLAYNEEVRRLLERYDMFTSWRDQDLIHFIGLILSRHAINSSHWSAEVNIPGGQGGHTTSFSFFHWRFQYDKFTQELIGDRVHSYRRSDVKAFWLDELRQFELEGSPRAARKRYISKVSGRYDFAAILRSRAQNESCDLCLCERWHTRISCLHVLCLSCLQALSDVEQNSPHQLSITGCPLCPSSGSQEPRISLRVQPRWAPLRVLDLDGGGIKGIVQIEVLRAISNAIGLDISMASYFDLIVGTSIGGICAIGIGLAGWSLDECAEKLKILTNLAFRGRIKSNRVVPPWLTNLLRALRLARRGSFYSGAQVSASLRAAFYDRRMVHPPSDDILPSYNVPKETCNASTFYRRPVMDSHYLSLEQAVAARATSAAPIYCDIVSIGDDDVQDGATQFNNPTVIAWEEAKMLAIYPTRPIYSLSIGCGSFAPSKRHSGLIDRITDYVLDQSDGGRQYRRFHLQAPQLRENTFRRLNPRLPVSDPALDDVDQIDELQRQVLGTLSSTDSQRMIHEVARELIAAIFYIDITQRLTTSNTILDTYCFVVHARLDRKKLLQLEESHKDLRLLVHYNESTSTPTASELSLRMIDPHDQGILLYQVSAEMPITLYPKAQTASISIMLKMQDHVTELPGSPFDVATLMNSCDPDRISKGGHVKKGKKRKRV